MIESKYLKDDIRNIQKLLEIRALKHFETKELANLLKLSKVRQYEDGEVIIQQGSTDHWLYFLLSGKIRVIKDKVEIGSTDRQGEIFGEMRIIDGLSRSASVFAQGRTICLAVNTAAKNRLPTDEEASNLLTLLYKMAAEVVSIRLRLSNEKLIQAQKEIKRLKDCIDASPAQRDACLPTAMQPAETKEENAPFVTTYG